MKMETNVLLVAKDYKSIIQLVVNVNHAKVISYIIETHQFVY